VILIFLPFAEKQSKSSQKKVNFVETFFIIYLSIKIFEQAVSLLVKVGPFKHVVKSVLFGKHTLRLLSLLLGTYSYLSSNYNCLPVETLDFD